LYIYKLENAECYYGKSLISAYLKEKEINGIGLFMDSDLEEFNEIFKSCKYNSQLNFIFLLQTLLRIKTYELELPIPNDLIETTYDFCWLEDEITLLHKYYINSNYLIIRK
jgi:hypothetical protein